MAALMREGARKTSTPGPGDSESSTGADRSFERGRGARTRTRSKVLGTVNGGTRSAAPCQAQKTGRLNGGLGNHKWRIPKGLEAGDTLTNSGLVNSPERLVTAVAPEAARPFRNSR